MNKEEKLKLVEELWLENVNEDMVCNRKQIMKQYKQQTGEEIPLGTLKRWIANLDKEGLYLSKSFNQRTDDIIDEEVPLYDPEDLLVAMGANPETFEMESTVLNRWWLDRGDILERIRNGQIKIRIKPKVAKVDEELIDRLTSKNVKPIYINDYPEKTTGLLEISTVDMHFGNNTYEDYERHKNKILKWIMSKGWEEILIRLGDDMFHWDNVNGTTTAGTQVGFQPDLEKAWEDALNFWTEIIEKAMEMSKNLSIIYVPGNHDTTLGWAFAKMIEKKYPQAIHDTRNVNYKLFTWEKIAIGMSHGNTPSAFPKYSKIFNELFRKEFAEAEVREIHLGDKHNQMVLDEFGIITRGLTTANKTDLWHYNKGYIGSSKLFQCFVYTEDSLEAMIFIK